VPPVIRTTLNRPALPFADWKSGVTPAENTGGEEGWVQRYARRLRSGQPEFQGLGEGWKKATVCCDVLVSG